ncbi:Cytochrome P450 [Mycena sanguinolenta]|uniref:Cytochrome P450 n=1 Tax=Mycena sanguinolenta TaxID=230812 RepID=A0A8H6ZA24_9AGAR|nr:Cytochrome P450 [Mycena sanguinolenta]
MASTDSIVSWLAVGAFSFLALHISLEKIQAVFRRRNLPPGPPRRLLRDNRADVPVSHFWKTFASWHKRYGPVVSFYLGQTLVIGEDSSLKPSDYVKFDNTIIEVLGTAEAAHDLLDKRGEFYSGRPRQIVGHEILSGGMRGIGMSYGPRYRRWKSFMQAGLNNTAVLKYRPLQSLECSLLIRDLLNSKAPLEYKAHIRRFVVSVIFCVGYGRRVKDLSDPVVVKNMEIGEYFIKVHVPGKFLVESWPSLLYLPRFLQWFRWEPERHRKLDTELYMSLMNDVKRQIAENTAQPSMAVHSLAKQEEFGLSDEEIAYALSAPWAGGVGTTVAAIEVFLLAMILFPAVQKKAQAEIDAVGRTPGFEDYEVLPYVQALIKEVTRWRCIAPTGVPHSTSQDDVYQGMFIPKGATVYANIYAMTTDPEQFPDGDEFRPERFLDNPQLRNYSIPFGFGRRLCPGQHVALQTLFISIVRILWAFEILPGVDDKGEVVIPSPDSFTSGLVVGPTPFPCRFEPRHSTTVEIVHNEAEGAEI